MDQVNRGNSFNSATFERARASERRLGRRDRRLEESTAASADFRSEDGLVGMPPPEGQNWPRVFPGL